MVVAGITFIDERPPAVAVPPVVLTPAIHVPAEAGGTDPVKPYAAASWQQQPNRYDRSNQQLYDMHAKFVRRNDVTGTRLDRLI